MLRQTFKPIQYRDGVCRMIDQRLLPTDEIWRDYFDYQGVAEAIRTMVVRGAPAIGIAAAFGAWFRITSYNVCYTKLLRP